VALDRESIEKKDLPIGRRGYEIEAVDAHLRMVADEVEALQKSGRRGTDRPESIAGSASLQVQTIIEAAEAAATQIRTEAEQETEDLRQEGRAEAGRVRQQAQQAREEVKRVSGAAASMLQRIEAMEQELGSVLDAFRSAGSRLQGKIQELEGALASAEAAPGAAAPTEPEGLIEEPVVTEDPAATEARPEPEAAPEGEAESADEDVEGARLVALNMALEGSSREEIDVHLAENFALRDRSALLDEVFAAVEG